MRLDHLQLADERHRLQRTRIGIVFPDLHPAHAMAALGIVVTALLDRRFALRGLGNRQCRQRICRVSPQPEG